MATRFYLPSSGTAPSITPAFDSAWEDTSIAVRLPVTTYKKNTALTTIAFDDANAANKDVLFRQYISPPLLAQTIAAQTIKFQIRASEPDSGNNLFTVIGIRVVSNNGTSVIGTILSVTRDATEIVLTTLTNRLFSATSSSLAVSEGDRLVIEIGLAGDPGNGKSHDGSIRIGDAAGSDLAENDTATTDDNPWVEFATGVNMRNVDYKIINISDNGSTTEVNYRVYSNNGLDPLTRLTLIGTYLKSMSGSNTVAQIQTELNNNECWKYGVPITIQR